MEGDLTKARALLARAGGFKAGKLERRLSLIDQAEAHTTAAQARLGRWPLRQLGLLPLVGRDVRVARAVADSATGTVRSTREDEGVKVPSQVSSRYSRFAVERAWSAVNIPPTCPPSAASSPSSMRRRPATGSTG